MMLSDLERQILDRCTDELGAPAGLMAEEFGVSTSAITKAAKKLQAEGLLADTGWAMKKRRDGNWDWIESKKTEGGMVSRPGASTVWKTTDAGNAALENNVQETTMPKRKKNQAETAGFDYAINQIQGDYFRDWVYDQLIEASKMDPSTVLPLETKADATKIAKNMLQRLEWDTKRDVGGHGNQYPKAWFEGFHRACEESREWLADELLEMKEQIRPRRTAEAPKTVTVRGGANTVRTGGAFKLGSPRPGTRVRDYIAVDNRGRKIAGPFKSYSDAKHAAGPAGHTEFVPSARTREVPRGVVRGVRQGSRRPTRRARTRA